MDKRSNPLSNAPDEGELLAAYLDAETDEVTAARLTRRLREEPELAARLDAIARARMRLQRLDDVPPPAQFRDRLAARLAAERTAPEPQTWATTRRRRYAPLVAAAAVALVAVLGATGVLRSLGAAGSAQTSGAESAESADMPAAAPDALNRGGDAGAGAGGDQAPRTSAGDAGGGRADQDEAAAAAPVPEVSNDTDISNRIREVLREPGVDPVQRERELRTLAGLPTATSCADEVGASVVDLVRQNGDLVITALAADRQPPQIVVLNPRTCTQIRVLGSGP